MRYDGIRSPWQQVKFELTRCQGVQLSTCQFICDYPGRIRMPQGKAVLAGLNQNGLIVFIILLLFCLPLCWIPWVVDSLKGEPE